MKKILLISPFPPAQNPRLIKEYETLKAEHFDVKVLYAERDKWASQYKPLKNEDFILVGGRYGTIFYYLTRLIHKLFRNLLPLTYGHDKVSWLLYLKALTIKADLYIGHNLATLPIVVKAAKKNKSKCGFDAEDFHRNEVTDDQSRFEFINAKALEDNFIEQVNYLTTASPLISRAYQELYPNIKPITINNVFSIKQLITSKKELSSSSYLKLFWFSQTIGKDRGIETVLEAIGLLKNKTIKLTLLGSITPNDKIYFEKIGQENGLLAQQLVFISPVAPENIFKIAHENDIGLALEYNSPYNRNICLTNKIFTYPIAGLTTIATETKAQKLFLEQYPYIGKSYPIGDKNRLAKILEDYLKNPQELATLKVQANKEALNRLNWEKESINFLAVINNVLKDA